MRLEKLQAYLAQKGWKYRYYEDEGQGSLNFEARGLKYHVWEFREGEGYVAESNVRTTGRSEDFTGDYEAQILEIMQSWQG